MTTPRELCKKFRGEIVALHKLGNGYKKRAKTPNVSGDTVGSIVCNKFKVKGKVATLPGHGRKRKLSTAATPES